MCFRIANPKEQGNRFSIKLRAKAEGISALRPMKNRGLLRDDDLDGAGKGNSGDRKLKDKK